MTDLVQLFTVVYLSVAALEGTAGLYKLGQLLRLIRRQWPRRHELTEQDREARATTASVAATMLTPLGAFVIASPPGYVAVDRLFGVPNIASAFVYSSVVLFTVATQAMTLFHRHGYTEAWPRVRRRLLVTGGVLLTMWVLFTLAATQGVVAEQHVVDFDAHYAREPLVMGFYLLFWTTYTVNEISLTSMTWHWAQQVRRGLLRLSLRLLSGGAAISLGYSLFKIVALGDRWRGGRGDLDVLSNMVGRMLASVGAMTMAAGVLLPVLGAPLLRWTRQLAHLRLHWALEPLWRELTTAFPEIVLVLHHPPRPVRSRLRRHLGHTSWYRHLDHWWQNRISLRGVEDRLYQRVVEIQDGLLALRPYMDPTVADTARRHGRAAGLTGTDLDTAVVASCLTDGLAAHGSGLPPTGNGPELPCPAENSGVLSVAHWLAQVARARTRSPLTVTASTVPHDSAGKSTT